MPDVVVRSTCALATAFPALSVTWPETGVEAPAVMLDDPVVSVRTLGEPGMTVTVVDCETDVPSTCAPMVTDPGVLGAVNVAL